MVALKTAEKRIVEEIFQMGGGYVLNFSNNSMADFFEGELGISIYQEKYGFIGTSKANHMRAFIKLQNAYTVAQLFRRLWEYSCSYENRSSGEEARDRARLFAVIARLESDQGPPVLSKLSGTAEIVSFDTVSRDLERALEGAHRDPESAITSACSTVESVCRSILIELGEELPVKRDIKGLFNGVKKPLGLSPDRPDIDPRIADDA